MGPQLSSEKFDALAEPRLHKRVVPPAFFRPQKVTQKMSTLGTVELAFLADGTLAGNAVLLGARQDSVAIRGVFFVDSETRNVTTEIELSCEQGTVEQAANLARHLFVTDDGTLAVREQKQQQIQQQRQQPDVDEITKNFSVEEISSSSSALPQQFMPPLKTDAELEQIAARQRRTDGRKRRHETDSDIALAAALSALGVTEPFNNDDHARFFIQPEECQLSGGDNSATAAASASQYKKNNDNNNDVTPPPPPSGKRSQSRQHQLKGIFSNAPLVAVGSSGRSPTSQHRSRSAGGATNNNGSSSSMMIIADSQLRRQQPQQRPKRLFERLGFTYELPSEHEELKALFCDWAGGVDFISREVFVRDILEFEAERGLELQSADIERLFDKVERTAGGTRDDKLCFVEFELFILYLSKA